MLEGAIHSIRAEYHSYLAVHAVINDNEWPDKTCPFSVIVGQNHHYNQPLFDWILIQLHKLKSVTDITISAQNP